MLVTLRYTDVRDSYKNVVIEMEESNEDLEKAFDPFEGKEFTCLSNKGFTKAVAIAKKYLDSEKKTYKSFSSCEIIRF